MVVASVVFFLSLLLLLEQMCVFLITAKQVAMRCLKQQPTFINNIFSLNRGFLSHLELDCVCRLFPLWIAMSPLKLHALKYQY